MIRRWLSYILHKIVRSGSGKGEIRTARSADSVLARDHSLDDLDALKWIGSSDPKQLND